MLHVTLSIALLALPTTNLILMDIAYLNNLSHIAQYTSRILPVVLVYLPICLIEYNLAPKITRAVFRMMSLVDYVLSVVSERQ